MCGGGGGILAPITNPIKQTVSSFTKVFTDPAHANLGQFASVAIPGLGGTVVSDIAHPTDIVGQAAVLGAAAGGAALAGAGTTAPVVAGSQVAGAQFAAPVGMNALDLPGGTIASYSATSAIAPSISGAASQFATGAAASAGGTSLLSSIGQAGGSLLSGVGTVAKDIGSVLVGQNGLAALSKVIPGLQQGASSAGSAISQNGILGSALSGLENLIGGASLGGANKGAATPTVIQAGAAGGSSTWMIFAAIGVAIYFFYFKKR